LYAVQITHNSPDTLVTSTILIPLGNSPLLNRFFSQADMKRFGIPTSDLWWLLTGPLELVVALGKQSVIHQLSGDDLEVPSSAALYTCTTLSVTCVCRRAKAR